MKTEVYSWRVSQHTKTALEEEARREGESLARLLDRIAREWLAARGLTAGGDEADQARLRVSAMKTFGVVRGGDPLRAEHARNAVRARLNKHRAV